MKNCMKIGFIGAGNMGGALAIAAAKAVGGGNLLIADANGDQAAYKKVKGRQRSFEEIVALLKASMIDPEKQVVYLTHADCAKEEIEGLVELIKAEIPCKDVEVGLIGPIIGASIGPDAVGIWGFGQEVTYKIGD